MAQVIWYVVNIAVLITLLGRYGAAQITALVVDNLVSSVNQGENGSLACRMEPPNAAIFAFQWIYNETGQVVYAHSQDGSFVHAQGHLVGRSSYSYNSTSGTYALYIFNSSQTVDTGWYRCQYTGGTGGFQNFTYYDVLLPTTAATTIDTTANDQSTFSSSVTPEPPGPPEPLQQRLQEKDEEELDLRAQASAMQGMPPLDMIDSPPSQEQGLEELQELHGDQDARVVAKKRVIPQPVQTNGAAGRQRQTAAEGET